ncbi:UNVERIFIED_CONTAM: Pentatricopeptide repeat-containing protein, mitochondrial [Sesamum radiatum]|uniref:Pentatricopeptide repeat-containing protein, mitochondrial n=1 Tax=Sesamum radiatum TaxID=300843 RepID=A0AAW2RDH5_SESRA
MRRNLRCMPSVFLAVRHKIYFINKSQYVEHPLRFLSRHPSIGTCLSFKPPHLTPPLSNDSLARLTLYASFNSSVDGQGEAGKDVDREFESDAEDAVTGHKSAGEFSSRDLGTLMDILRTGGTQDKSKKLEQCGVNVTPGLVANVLSGTRNDWETAFTFFLWAGKQPGYQHSLREYHSMIAILGKFRKFDTAWSLIDDMRAASLVNPHTLLIMMRRYAAVHDVAKAINTFYGLRRFKFEIGMEEFQGLLSALCRLAGGEENLEGDGEEGIRHDVYSYGSIMSCHSKVNHLNIVLRLYEEMKALGIKPDKKVYNAVIHALAKGRLVKEAWSLMKTMDEEGFTPDVVTYNSLIMPLCKSRLLDKAKQVFDEMTEKGLRPTVRTYHAFFRVLRTGEEVFELLQRMCMTGCHPSHDTYIMLIRKFCRWRQLDNVLKLWTEMSRNGLDPDRSSYIVLIHGLFLNGRLEEAHKYYLEMKEKHLLPEPKIDAMLQAWVAGKTDADWHMIASKDDQFNSSELGKGPEIDPKKKQGH